MSSHFDEKGYPRPVERHLWVELPVSLDKLTDEQAAFIRVRLESAALSLVRMIGADREPTE